jgi:hypothetical protein
MKAIFKATDQLTLEFDNVDQKTLFTELCNCQEVFNNESCGKCKSTNIKYSVREAQGGKYIYHEKICLNCYARLGYGVHQTGDTLFPKRKNAETNEKLANNGWLKYNTQTQQLE